MGKKRYTPEQIIRKLREVEVLISQGMKTPDCQSKIDIVKLIANNTIGTKDYFEFEYPSNFEEA